jgi:hypothetical protein
MIFVYPFEYPRESSARVSRNEAYLLRAFLEFNRSSKFACGTTSSSNFISDWLKTLMPRGDSDRHRYRW